MSAAGDHACLFPFAKIVRIFTGPHGAVYLRPVRPVKLSWCPANIRCGQPKCFPICRAHINLILFSILYSENIYRVLDCQVPWPHFSRLLSFSALAIAFHTTGTIRLPRCSWFPPIWWKNAHRKYSGAEMFRTCLVCCWIYNVEFSTWGDFEDEFWFTRIQH